MGIIKGSLYSVIAVSPFVSNCHQRLIIEHALNTFMQIRG